MPSIILPRHLQRQPQHVAGLAEAWRDDARYVLVGGTPINLARGAYAGSSKLSHGVSPHGRTWQTAAGNNNYATLGPSDTVLPTGNQVTLLIAGAALTTDGHGMCGTFGSSGVDACHLYMPFVGGTTYWRWGGMTEGSTQLSLAGLSFSRRDVFGFTTGPRGMEIWQNGRRVAANSGTPTRVAGVTNFALGTVADTTGDAVEVALFATLGRQLPQHVLSELTANPWRLFQHPRRALYFDTAAGGAALAGVAASQAAASASLATQIPIAAAAAVVASAAGALTTAIPLAGAAIASSAVGVALGTGVQLAGQAAGVSLAGGVLTAQITLSGTALAQALAGAGLVTGIPVAGAAAAQAGASGTLAGIETRYARPMTDLAVGGWTAFGGGALYAAIDETVADDLDYVSWTGGEYCEIRLSQVADPGTSINQGVYFRAWAPGGSGWLSVQLYQGATQIATLTFYGTLPATPSDYVMSLTPAQADSITDYADLRIRLYGLIGETVVSAVWLDVQLPPVALAGASAAITSAVASLTTQISLAGAALATALAAAGLTTQPAGLAGAAGAQAAAAGALLTQIPLAATPQAYATAAGGITTLIPLAGASASLSSATGNLTIEATLTGAALATALAGGDLTTVIRLEAAALAQAATQGALAAATGIPGVIPHSISAPAAVYEIDTHQSTWEIAA